MGHPKSGSRGSTRAHNISKGDIVSVESLSDSNEYKEQFDKGAFCYSPQAKSLDKGCPRNCFNFWPSRTRGEVLELTRNPGPSIRLRLQTPIDNAHRDETRHYRTDARRLNESPDQEHQGNSDALQRNKGVLLHASM